MVVFDASTIVGAALKRDGIPRQALVAARSSGPIALSRAVFQEVSEVLLRPKFANAISAETRAEVTGLLLAAAVWAEGNAVVEDCRDAKDNKYLELAANAHADVIVSSDEDLLVLHPWRGVRILRPRQFLEGLG